MAKEYKYLGMAEIIRDYLISFKGKENVANHYIYGKQVPGTEKGKGNVAYAFDYEIDKIL